MNNQKMMANKGRKSENGAALVMVVLISFLLLVASAGLLLAVATNTSNVTDSTAEQQAYNAAESGIQSAINVMRGNTPPNQLFDSTKPATDPVNRIDFKKAVARSSSNLSTDTSTTARLSRWIPYDYQPETVSDWRVSLGVPQSATYDPKSGYAFQVSIIDPDDSSGPISFFTSGTILKEYVGATNADKVIITYESASKSNLAVATGAATTDLGNIRFDVRGQGGTISERIRFLIAIQMTSPYESTKYVRGWIEPGSNGRVTQTSIGTVTVLFDSQLYSIRGSTITLSGGVGVNDMTVSPPIVGYRITPSAPNVNNGRMTINATITACEPTRLTVRSTGFGPRGAKKTLEAIIRKNFFDGMMAPATLTLIGPNAGGGFVFNPGTSNAMQYSGDDVASNFYIPPIGTVDPTNLQTVQDSVDGEPPNPFNGTVVGTPSDVSGEMPTWLQSPTKLNQTVESLRTISETSGRYYASGTLPTDGFGDNSTGRGLTFLDGNAEFTGNGGGILVCTGTLTLNGNFNFNGIIIVIGAGGITRTGGGTGILQGNVIIAPYNKNDLLAGFLPPKYDLSGGGNSGIIFNSTSVQDGLVGASNFVMGVAEK